MEKRKKQVKIQYLNFIEEERKKIKSEMDNYRNQLSLLDYNCSNLEDLIQTIQINKTKIFESTKLEALKA